MKLIRKLKEAFTVTRAILLASACFLVYAIFVQIPIPFDEQMRGRVMLSIGEQTVSDYGLSSQNAEDESDLSLDSSWLLFTTCVRENFNFVSRELQRDGEMVTVVFFNSSNTIAESIINVVVYGPGSYSPISIRLAGRASGYAQRMVEVYHFPTNTDRLRSLDNEMFDGERYSGTRVWRGLI